MSMRKIQTAIYLLEAVCVSLSHLVKFLDDEPLKREADAIREAFEQRKIALTNLINSH